MASFGKERKQYSQLGSEYEDLNNFPLIQVSEKKTNKEKCLIDELYVNVVVKHLW